MLVLNKKIYVYKGVFDLINFFVGNNLALFFYTSGIYYYFFFKLNKVFNNFVALKKYDLTLSRFFLFNNLFLQRLNFLEFFIDGVYYRLKYYKTLNVIGFLLGHNHYILFYLPKDIYAKIHMKKRKFFLYGYDKEKLATIGAFMVNFKYPNLFIGKGLKIKSVVYRRKIVKKKKKR